MARLCIFEYTGMGAVNVEVYGGATYHVRDVLKRLGFKWDAEARKWRRHEADADEVRSELVRELERRGFTVTIVKERCWSDLINDLAYYYFVKMEVTAQVEVRAQ